MHHQRSHNRIKRFTFPRRQLLRLGVVFVGIVVLGILDALTEYLGSHALGGDTTNNPIPGLMIITLYLVYMILMLAQPRLAVWSRWRFTYTYLLVIFALTLMVGFFASSLLQVLGYLAIFGGVAQARTAFGKAGSWLVVSVLVLAILLDTLVIRNLAIATMTVWSPLQMAMWLIGLAFVQTFTGLGVQERGVRLRNEELVEELTTAQEQLRAYAVHAEEVAIIHERARMAREMHDTLAQGLAAIKMHLETGRAVFDTQPEAARQHMEYARSLAGEHLHDTRTSILELRIDALSNQPLPTALARLSETWRSRQGNVTFRASAGLTDRHFVPAIELAYYRVTQEAITNALGHGHATQVAIELSIEGDELCLTITDDGVGFDPATVQPYNGTGGFGIIGMSERLRLLQGRLDVISAPGRGAQIVAMVPLNVAYSDCYSVRGKKDL